MKISFKETIEKEIEIEFPYYSKSTCHFFKVISENESMTVCYLDKYECSIERKCYVTPMSLTSEPSNEKEFNDAFNKVSKLLKSK